jgi:citrate lyase subunit beta / citryl-CoA lyase
VTPATGQAPLRSWMFVPGDKPRFLAKVPILDLDVALLDLEDGVLPENKPTARALVRDAIAEPRGRALRYVRLNASTTPWFTGDLAEVVVPGLDGVCLTKVNSAGEVAAASAAIASLERERGLSAGSVRVVAAIESARGLLAAPAVAAADPRVIALIFGAEDYALDLGLAARRTGESADLLHARSAIVVAATAAGVGSIDGVYPDLDDDNGMERDTIAARRIGFTAKSTFNPRQIALINALFAPNAEEIEYARQVAKAFDEAASRGDASVAVGGQLVDRPIVLRALQTLTAIGERDAAS